MVDPVRYHTLEQVHRNYKEMYVSEFASPLDGVKVLDFSQGTSGGIATKLMAVMGADVIKVEPPGSGDVARSVGPFPGDEPHPEKSGRYLYLNMNKRSITLSLEESQGQEVASELYRWPDLVIENFHPGQLDVWGLGYSTLERINPEASLVSIAPFGQSGPYRDFRSNDMIEQALGGLMYVTGDPRREPLRIGGEPAEYFAGLSAFSGALVAHTVRELGGGGQHVDVSAHEGVALAQMYSGLSYIFTGQERGRQPASPLYEVSDGYIGVSLRQQDWPGVCEMIGQPDLINDERFVTMGARRINHEALTAILSEQLKEQKKEDLYHEAQKHGMSFGYICTAEDLMNSAQYQHREFFKEIEHSVAGTLTYPGVPMRWGDEGWELRPAPLLGEHNAEVYGELLGWSSDDLERMLVQGII